MDTLYDERGAQYKVPMYCFANPVELVGESPNGQPSAGSAVTVSPGQSPAIPTAVQVPTASPVRVVSSSKTQEGKALNLKIRINPGRRHFGCVQT
jgi:hypothetical protein